MSKGPGTVQRALLEFFRRRPFAAADLWELKHALPHADLRRYLVPKALRPAELKWASERSAYVSIMRACRALSKRGALPLAWKRMPGQRGGPRRRSGTARCEVVIYRTDNPEAVSRATQLCDPANQGRTSGMRTTQRPTRTRDTSARVPPHVLGAIASARKLLVSQGKSASRAEIVEVIGRSCSLDQIEAALATLQSSET